MEGLDKILMSAPWVAPRDSKIDPLETVAHEAMLGVFSRRWFEAVANGRKTGDYGVVRKAQLIVLRFEQRIFVMREELIRRDPRGFEAQIFW